MKTQFTIALCAALGLGGTAIAQSDADWDSDSDGSVSRDEWTTGMGGSNAFSDWDADGSGMVDGAEYAGGTFDRFDKDGDDNLSPSEWDDGIDRVFGEQAVDLTFDVWDADNDQVLGREEFSAKYQELGLFDMMRQNAGMDTSTEGLSQEDFSTATFDSMDANDDDMLSSDENTWMQ